MNQKTTPILVVLLVVAAFLIGMFWTKIQYLEGNKGAVAGTAAGGSTPPSTAQPAQPSTKPITAQQMATLASKGVAKGPAGAKVTIVEFSDFQCPYCSRVLPTVQQIMDTYKDKVRIVFRQYPLSFHENAQAAAEASLCANDQDKFWEMHDKMFANQDKLTVTDLKQYAADLGLNAATFNTCLDNNKYKEAIQTDISDANAVGVSGTPAFFINGEPLFGAYPFASFKAIIDAQLAK
ncbi:MAG: thioredoxin domain-containing protein [Candidatus Gottesmanbacteria bacterium]